MTVQATPTRNVRDKASGFFVIGSFVLMGIAAVLMAAGGAGMLALQGHAVPPYVLAAGAGLYGAGMLSFVLGVVVGLTPAPKLAKASA